MKVKINQILFLVIIFGTGILYYVNNVPIYSHIYEFFVLSLVLFFSLRFYKYELNYDLFLLSVALIFSLLVRYNNFNSFLIPFIIIIFETIRNENKRISNTKIFKLLFSVTLSFCIVNLVTIFVYDAYIFQFQKIYGDGASSKIFENYEILYILKKIFLVYKNFYKLIFTLEQGVIFSNPLTFFVLFFILYLFFFYVKKNYLNLLIIGILKVFIFFSFSYFIMLSWKSNAGSYGYRYLLNLLPLVIYFTIIFFEIYKNKKILKYIKIIIIIFSINSFVSQLFADTTKNLSQTRSINIFLYKGGSAIKNDHISVTRPGVITQGRDGVYVNYNKNLLNELLRVNLYITTLAKSMGGLFISFFLEKFDLFNLFDENLYAEYKNISLIIHLN